MPRNRTTPMNHNTTPQPFLQPLTSLLLLNPDPGRWHIQRAYPGPFIPQKRRMREQDVERVLRGEHWLASCAPSDGIIDRIEMDLDCRSPDDRDEQVARYRRIRRLMGIERQPLVISTPSGLGLHVSYRIPPTPLQQVVTGYSSGLLVDILQAAHLEVRPGQIEIFPQGRQCKRIPLGRHMSILDPESLEPVPGLSTWGSPERMIKTIAFLSRWFSAPHEELVSDLKSRAPARPRAAPEPASGDVSHGDGSLPQLVDIGLTRRSSRHEVEFRVGMAIWQNPSGFLGFGLSLPPDRENVAEVLATWLSRRHNGLSAEWTESRLRRTVQQAIDHWTKRYLRRDGNPREAPIDRMRRAAESHRTDSGLVSPSDMIEIMTLGDVFSGKERYAFETWTCALMRATKSADWFNRRNARGLPAGAGFVEVELQAAWMERWPWGSGRIRGERGYVTYRAHLLRMGWLVPVTPYLAVPDLPGRATRYRIRTPLPFPSSDLPVPYDAVVKMFGKTKICGRLVTVDEAYHALFVNQHVKRLDRRYGPSTGARIRGLCDLLGGRAAHISF